MEVGSVKAGTHTGRPDVDAEEALEGGEEHDGHHHDLSLRHVDGAEGEGARYVGLPVSTVEQGGGTQTLRQEEVRDTAGAEERQDLPGTTSSQGRGPAGLHSSWRC